MGHFLSALCRTNLLPKTFARVTAIKPAETGDLDERARSGLGPSYSLLLSCRCGQHWLSTLRLGTCLAGSCLLTSARKSSRGHNSRGRRSQLWRSLRESKSMQVRSEIPIRGKPALESSRQDMDGSFAQAVRCKLHRTAVRGDRRFLCFEIQVIQRVCDLGYPLL